MDRLSILGLFGALLLFGCTNPPDGSSQLKPGLDGFVVLDSEIQTGDISPNGSVELTLEMATVPIRSVAVVTNRTAGTLRIEVANLGGTPEGPDPPPNEDVYRYLEVGHPDLASDSIVSATIRFIVPEAWLEAAGHAASLIALARYTDRWTTLPTRETGRDNGEIHYEATAPGLSLFAIVVSAHEGGAGASPRPSKVETPTHTPTASDPPSRPTASVDPSVRSTTTATPVTTNQPAELTSTPQSIDPPVTHIPTVTPGTIAPVRSLPTPTVSPTPSPTPSPSASPKPAPMPTHTSTPEPSPTATAPPTGTPSPTQSPTPTALPPDSTPPPTQPPSNTKQPTSTPSPAPPTAKPTATPTHTTIPTPTPTPTPTETSTPAPAPTSTPTPTQTPTPTETPTPVPDDRYGVVVHRESAYFLEQLGVTRYLKFNSDMSAVPDGTEKLPFIQVSTDADVWESGQAASLESLSDEQIGSLGFFTRQELRDMAQSAPGSSWYVFGEANLLMFSDSVLPNWPAKMSDYGDINVDSEGAGKTSGAQQLTGRAHDPGPGGNPHGSERTPHQAHPGGL